MPPLATLWRNAVACVLTVTACDGGTGVGDDADGIVVVDGDSGELDEDGTNGDGAPEGDEAGGSAGCKVIVDELVITDATDPSSVRCVEQIIGDLTIGPTTELVNLEMLSRLEQVGGTVFIAGNRGLDSLIGLENLRRADWVHVRRNPRVKDLRGFDALESVARLTLTNNASLVSLLGLPSGLRIGWLEIADNDALSHLHGLPKLVPFADDQVVYIEIEDNAVLSELTGLSVCCSQMPVALLVARNDELDSLAGLEGFSSFVALRLYDNPALSEFAGLSSLTELDRFEVDYNHCVAGDQPEIVDFSALKNVERVGRLSLTWVSGLTDLSGFDDLTEVDELVIRNNEQLPWSLVEAFVAQVQVGDFDGCGGPEGPTCPPEICPTL